MPPEGYQYLITQVFPVKRASRIFEETEAADDVQSDFLPLQFMHLTDDCMLTLVKFKLSLQPYCIAFLFFFYVVTINPVLTLTYWSKLRSKTTYFLP